MTIPTLRTDRLILRGPQVSDMDAYAAFFADPEASAFYGGPMRRDQAYDRLCQDLGHWQLNGFGRWVITWRDTGEVLGGTGLLYAEGWPRTELTWWLLPAARGNGVATEASRAVIAWAYETLGWDLVETHMKDANTAARRLVERLGGTRIDRLSFPDGLQRDIWALPNPREAAA
ncbi:MAG: GNAT family N-acetyltransferase [Pseudomonadota bacterium]